MQAYKVSEVSCDGGRIGGVYREYYFVDEKKAESFLAELVKRHNDKETARTENFIQREKEYAEYNNKQWWRLYYPDKVEDIRGYACWSYMTFIYIQPIEIEE